MTTPDDIARAWEAFLDVLVRAPWVSRPDRASADLEERRRELRALAVRIDRAHWPRGVATLLWTPAPHEIRAVRRPAPVVPIPPPTSDCPACE